MVTFAFIHADTIAEIGTAVGTLALAGATYWMARKTAAAAKSANEAAEVGKQAAQAAVDEARATLRLVTLTESQMQQGQLPVVVPIVGEISVPQTRGKAVVHVPIKNTGVGPALGIRVTLSWHRADEVARETAMGRLVFLPLVGGLGIGEVSVVRTEPMPIAAHHPIEVSVKYSDTLGVEYIVEATYNPRKPGFSPLVMSVYDGHGEVAKKITI